MKKLSLSFILIFVSNLIFAQTNIEILNQLKNYIENTPQNNRFQNTLWRQPEKPNIWEEYIVTQVFYITRNNINISGYNRNNLDGTWEGIIVNYEPVEIKNNPISHISDSNAKNIYNEIINIFGKPDRILDYGFFQNQPNRRDLIAQWDKGKYQIELNLIDIAYLINNSGINFIHLRIMKAGEIKSIIPLSGIRIIITNGYYTNSRGNRNNINTNDNFVFSLILDYNSNEVLNTNLLTNGKITNLDNSQVVFERNINNGGINETQKYILDRYNGSIEIISYNNNGSIVGIMQGKVERFNAFEPLF
jgi:hypothetical protein